MCFAYITNCAFFQFYLSTEVKRACQNYCSYINLPWKITTYILYVGDNFIWFEYGYKVYSFWINKWTEMQLFSDTKTEKFYMQKLNSRKKRYKNALYHSTCKIMHNRSKCMHFSQKEICDHGFCFSGKTTF